MINCLHVTQDYRGDHSADVKVAIEVKPNETVEELCQRTIGMLKNTDHLELRMAK